VPPTPATSPFRVSRSIPRADHDLQVMIGPYFDGKIMITAILLP
jgi:hypothetical protein